MGREAGEQMPNEEAEDGGCRGSWMTDTDESGKGQKKRNLKGENLILKPEFLRTAS